MAALSFRSPVWKDVLRESFLNQFYLDLAKHLALCLLQLEKRWAFVATDPGRFMYNFHEIASYSSANLNFDVLWFQQVRAIHSGPIILETPGRETPPKQLARQ